MNQYRTLVWASQGKKPVTDPPPPEGDFYFAKDFQGVTLTGSGGTRTFVDWGLDGIPQCDRARLNFIASTMDYTPCAMVLDPAGSGRTVLKMQVLDDDPNWSGTSRAQLDIDFDSAFSDLGLIHMSCRVRLHPDMANMVSLAGFNNSWFTLQEFWFDRISTDNPAGAGRITLYVKEVVAGKLNLRADFQRTPSGQQITIWQQDNLPYEIPYGQWFTMDTYVKRGLGAAGQYKLVITIDGQSPVTVFDIQNTTYLTDAPDRKIIYFAPFKLYGGDGPVYDGMRNAGWELSACYNDLKWYKQ